MSAGFRTASCTVGGTSAPTRPGGAGTAPLAIAPG